MVFFEVCWWLYCISSSVGLLWWLFVGGFKAHRKYERELVYVAEWQKYFKENVPSSWVFYDGLGT